MSKKIIARLQDGNHSILFNQDSNGFAEIECIYNEKEFDYNNTVKFNPERQLEEDEWYFIDINQDQKNEIIKPYIDTIDNSDGMNPITKEEYPNVRAICLIEKNNTEYERIFLTRIYPRFYTLSKKYISWQDEPKLEKRARSIEFTGSLDAFWNGDKLYFKKYENINSVFPGIECFYRLANEEEVNDFLQKDFFELPASYKDFKIDIKRRNLRKIASVMDSINWNDPSIQDKYIQYAKRYPAIGVNITDNNRLMIKSNKDITNIMNILEERIYTTPITEEEREANSITKIGY